MYYKNINITSFDDLFDQIISGCVAENWSVEYNQDIGIDRQIVISNSDNSVFVGFKTEYKFLDSNQLELDVINSYLTCNVFSSFDDTKALLNQENGYNNYNKYFSFKQQDVSNLFLNITSNRIAFSIINYNMVTNFSGGKFLQYCSPSQQPNGYYIDSQTNLNNNLNQFINNKIYSDIKSSVDGTWASREIYPKPSSFINININKNDETYTIFPIVIIDDVNGYALGEVDGVYLISNLGVSAGDTFYKSGKEYIILPFSNFENTLYCFEK